MWWVLENEQKTGQMTTATAGSEELSCPSMNCPSRSHRPRKAAAVTDRDETALGSGDEQAAKVGMPGVRSSAARADCEKQFSRTAQGILLKYRGQIAALSFMREKARVEAEDGVKAPVNQTETATLGQQAVGM